jgi:hypothetical protein
MVKRKQIEIAPECDLDFSQWDSSTTNFFSGFETANEIANT